MGTARVYFYYSHRTWLRDSLDWPWTLSLQSQNSLWIVSVLVVSLVHISRNLRIKKAFNLGHQLFNNRSVFDTCILYIYTHRRTHTCIHKLLIICRYWVIPFLLLTIWPPSFLFHMFFPLHFSFPSQNPPPTSNLSVFQVLVFHYSPDTSASF